MLNKNDEDKAKGDKMEEFKNKRAHEAVLLLLFSSIISSEQANKLHEKIDKKIKK